MVTARMSFASITGTEQALRMSPVERTDRNLEVCEPEVLQTAQLASSCLA